MKQQDHLVEKENPELAKFAECKKANKEAAEEATQALIALREKLKNGGGKTLQKAILRFQNGKDEEADEAGRDD